MTALTPAGHPVAARRSQRHSEVALIQIKLDCDSRRLNYSLHWSGVMCLGVPMQVIAVDGHRARCSVQGVEREVSLFLLQDEPISLGDFVLVHVGYAIQKMTPQDARSTWELFDEVLAAADADSHA